MNQKTINFDEMSRKRLELRKELSNLKNITLSLDRKVVIIFLSIAVLQTISWYITSRSFFRYNIFPYYDSNPDIYLIEYLYWFIGDSFTFLVLPVLIIRFVIKEKISDYGMKVGDWQTGLILSLIFLMIMLPLVWMFSSSKDFVSNYPQLLSVRTAWNIFFIYESGMLIYMFAWEFIWRGFTLFGLEEKFGYYAVLIQMIPFVILHNGKPMAETFGAILGGIALGILALRTRSFLYGVIVHIGIMFSIDLICTLRFRADDYGIGLNSIINIISKIF
jgi:membrane protease YdiL (CAAX protease family)